MSQIIAVTAGKGGTGKSTSSANIATGIAALGHKTLLLELDFGLRCQDIILGVREKTNHDIGEYLEGRIEILAAANKVARVPNLSLICATKKSFIEIDAEKIISVCEELREQFTMAIGALYETSSEFEIDDLLCRSEALMYKDKDIYYRTSGADRRKR